MKEHDVKLTLQETEQLCRLYMDCKLTVLEETELQYVLGKMPYSSPCIDEARMLMGVSLPTKALKTSKSISDSLGTSPQSALPLLLQLYLPSESFCNSGSLKNPTHLFQIAMTLFISRHTVMVND